MLVIILWADIRLHVHNSDRCIFRTIYKEEGKKLLYSCRIVFLCVCVCASLCRSLFGWDFLLLQWLLLPAMEFLRVSFELCSIFVSFSPFDGSAYLVLFFFFFFWTEKGVLGPLKKESIEIWRIENEPTMIWKKSMLKMPTNVTISVDVLVGEIKTSLSFCIFCFSYSVEFKALFKILNEKKSFSNSK